MKLPLKHRKNILEFCREYERLCRPRKIKVTLSVGWIDGDELTVLEDLQDHIDPEIKSENSKIRRFIRRFIKRADAWGLKHFGNKDWLWENVFWEYRPERLEKFNSSNVSWQKDTDPNEKR